MYWKICSPTIGYLFILLMVSFAVHWIISNFSTLLSLLFFLLFLHFVSVCYVKIQAFSKCLWCLVFIFFKILFIYFRERGRVGEREGEKHQCVVACHTTPLRTWPATQACALTGNRTSDPLFSSLALNPLSHTKHGCALFFKIHVFKTRC